MISHLIGSGLFSNSSIIWKNVQIKKRSFSLTNSPGLIIKNLTFIPALEHFWNSWAAARDDILLIVCGSAASWIINKLINHKGGLHNRVTERIKLELIFSQRGRRIIKTKKRRNYPISNSPTLYGNGRYSLLS